MFTFMIGRVIFYYKRYNSTTMLVRDFKLSYYYSIALDLSLSLIYLFRHAGDCTLGIDHNKLVALTLVIY